MTVAPLGELIRGVGAQMRIDFENISAQVPHMGERGRSREDVIVQFLQNYAPRRIGVSRGIIVDHTGTTSPECDVILYDAESTPVFRVSESVRLFPAETVFSVVQVKSSLTKPHLKSAIENIRAVTRLRRANETAEPMLAGYNLRLFTGEEGIMTYNPKPIVGGIFAFDSPGIESVARNLVSECGRFSPFEWPSFIVSLNKGSIFYIAPSGTPSPGELTAGSAKEQLVIATDEEHHPLVMFYTALLARAQRTLCATPDLFAHLGIRSFRSTSIELERSRSQNPE